MNAKTVKINKFKKRFTALAKHPFFWILTAGGNSIILVGSALLYTFEANTQQPPMTFLDSILWSTGTVTTIGYGNYHPQSFSGKITILFLMLAGTLFVWSYMAFLVTALIAPEPTSLEKDVHDVEKEIQGLRQEDKQKIEINNVSKTLIKKEIQNEKQKH